MSTPAKGIVIPLSILGILLGLILTGFGVARAWGNNEARLTTVEQRQDRSEKYLEMIPKIDGKVDTIITIMKEGK